MDGIPMEVSVIVFPKANRGVSVYVYVCIRE